MYNDNNFTCVNCKCKFSTEKLYKYFKHSGTCYLYRLQGKIPFFGNKYFSYKSITTRVLCCYNVILGIFIQVTPFVNIIRQTKQIAPSKPNKLIVWIGWVIYLYPIQLFKR